MLQSIFKIRNLAAFAMGVVWVLFWEKQYDWLIVMLVLVLIVLYVVQKKWFQFVCTPLIYGAIGVAYAVLRVQWALQQQWPVEMYPQATFVSIRVDSLVEKDEWGRKRFLGEAQTIEGKSYQILFSDYYDREWQVGEKWRVKARIRAPIGTVNPFGTNREAWALVNGIDGLASLGKDREKLPEKMGFSPWYWVQEQRSKISAAWQMHIEAYPQGVGLMQALSIGNRSGLSQSMWETLRPLGMNHLVAISGLHISMVALMAAWLMKKCLMFLPLNLQRPRLWQAWAGVMAACIYTALSGLGIPALRSLMMLSVAAVAWCGRYYFSAWQIWWLALCSVLIYQPSSVLSAGFWLSFGLVAALLWGLAYRIGIAKTTQIWQGQWVASVASLPLLAYGFGLIPVFSPLVNMVAIPIFTFILVPLSLISSILPFDFSRKWSACLGEWVMQGLSILAQWLPEYTVIFTPLPLLFLSVMAIAILLLPRGHRLGIWAGSVLLALFLYQPKEWKKGVKIVVWDVGQGLSVWIQTPSSHLLFDTGTPASATSLLPNLRATGVSKWDDVILSHHDNDHDGGYEAIKKQFKIQRLWAGQPEFYSDAHYCEAGKTWQRDGVDFEFLTPLKQHKNDNELSCVLRLVYDNKAVLITGDLGIQGEEELVKKYGNQLFSDILILGHHGSKTSSSGLFINAVQPYYAVASSGFANAFKHPHPDVQNTLKAHHVSLIRTDTQGAWQFIFNQDGIQSRSLLDDKKWWQRKPFY